MMPFKKQKSNCSCKVTCKSNAKKMKWERFFSSSFEIAGSKTGGSHCLNWGKNPGYEGESGWGKTCVNPDLIHLWGQKSFR